MDGTATVMQSDDKATILSGDLDAHVDESGRLYVYDYSMREEDREHSGLVFCAERGNWQSYTLSPTQGTER